MKIIFISQNSKSKMHEKVRLDFNYDMKLITFVNFTYSDQLGNLYREIIIIISVISEQLIYQLTKRVLLLGG